MLGTGPNQVSVREGGPNTPEGLKTLLLGGFGVGGRAATIPCVENHLGLPAGISGFESTRRGAQWARTVGAYLSGRSQGTAVDEHGGH